MRLKFSYFVKNQSMKIFLFPCSIGVRAQNGNRAALAVIDERGLKRIRAGRTKIKVLAQKIPIIRGICYFFAAIFAGIHPPIIVITVLIITKVIAWLSCKFATFSKSVIC